MLHLAFSMNSSMPGWAASQSASGLASAGPAGQATRRSGVDIDDDRAVALPRLIAGSSTPSTEGAATRSGAAMASRSSTRRHAHVRVSRHPAGPSQGDRDVLR